ncbi:ParB/RepB/Spo0J family partition protein [Chelatococcus asaccharovorans]|uniref:ParB family chromosome partitioning protein n=1 Tax=Chelatococcus asaccharovorans TaxID=28210 RepID=A0A2V3UB25_9HYPH|nr:ParB/RepB/Spo0J family partition protein [Chelatococcus asaccharovorans]MBS7703296.1 ParB/RepB/Spo0J family partition protein [Chelatococcus asaccharovorans]PXW61629.1 ParB family chromosome partitioning protein [Chelatococcus asaccharovorans]
MLKRIPLERVVPNPDQPRKEFETKALHELAASILQNGLMQPITVTPRGDGTFMIIAGERRWRAHCLLAGRGQLEDQSILAHVRRTTDDEVAVMAIVENLQRQDISPLEEATAFQAMVDRGYAVEKLAEMLGCDAYRIREKLALLGLDEQLRKLVQTGQLGYTTGALIGRLEKHQQQTIASGIAKGKIGSGYYDVAAAVKAFQNPETQQNLMDLPVVSQKDQEALSALERKIEQISVMVAAGFKDGECVAAQRVDPNRYKLMIEKLALIKTAIYRMERQLRDADAQAALFAA